MITYTQFLKEVRSLLAEIGQELTNRRAGKDGFGSVEELTEIQEELANLEAKAAAGSLPPKGHRFLAAARIVTDGWSLDQDLGPRICRLADLYRRKLP